METNGIATSADETSTTDAVIWLVRFAQRSPAGPIGGEDNKTYVIASANQAASGWEMPLKLKWPEVHYSVASQSGPRQYKYIARYKYKINNTTTKLNTQTNKETITDVEY